MGKGKELTIGLLVSGITDSFTVSVCRGVITAAKEAGIKLIIFPGKYLDRDFSERKEIFYEYQYNMVFSYAQKEMLDAILISANTIGCFTDINRIQEMVKRFAGIPCVLIASKIDGYTSVNFDNSSGIKEAIDYLVRDLKCTKIGMIGGPDNNTDAYERKIAFKQALTSHGLSLPANRYIEGDLSRYSLNTFRTFLQQNPDIEAIFCVNDDTAIGLYEVLKEKNITPGTHLLVFGYDNIPFASNMKPALSSVWADPVRLGKRSVEMICKMLNGENVQSEVLTTRFIKRESLGYKEKKDYPSKGITVNTDTVNAIFNDIFYRYPSEQNKAEYAQFRDSFQQLIDYLITQYSKKEPNSTPIQALPFHGILFDQKTLEYMDVENFIENIENLNSITRYAHTDISSAIYKKLILTMKQQYGELADTQFNQQYSMMVFVKDIMSFETGNDQSYAVLLEHLEWLNIKNAYIYTYEKPMLHLFKEEFHLPDKLYLKATLKDGVVQSVPSSCQETNASEIYTNQNVAQNDLPLVLFPLYSNETIYGVLLCDMTESLYETGDFFVNQMSSAVKVINLLKNNAVIQQQLEDSLATLKENNIALDTLSKYDALTGILNRRGFFDSAEKFLQQSKDCQMDTIVAYIDMNNLKIINDRYGHDEGDFSIKKIGELLERTASDKGIVGRIGGDEFALIMNSGEGNDIAKQIYAQFQAFNQTNEKPYILTVSAGVTKICPDSPLTLSEALTIADEKLYIEKQKRTKNVAK